MANVTHFVALPLVRGENGELVAGEAQDRQSAGAAESAARRMAETSAGAVAFSRTGERRVRGCRCAARVRQGAEHW